MNEKEIMHHVRDYMQVWNAGNEDRLDYLAAGDIEVEYTHFGTKYQGVGAYKEVLKMTAGFFPDLRITVNEIIVSGEKSTVLWEYTGTHRNGNLFGAPPAGKAVKVAGITILEFKDGRVIRERGIVDNLSLLMQLGVLK